MITVHPEKISQAMLDAVDMALAVGDAPQQTLKPLGKIPGSCWRTARCWPGRAARPSLSGSFRARPSTGGTGASTQPANLAEEAFVFRGPENKLKLRAQNLSIFLQMAEGIDDDTWLHHLGQRDYSKWFRSVIKDDGLAEEAEQIERGGGRESRRGSRKRSRSGTHCRSDPYAYEMSSSSEPSGSRKYTLIPIPRTPKRRTGPSSTATRCRSRWASASPMGPGHSKQRSLPPGSTGRRATGVPSIPGPWRLSCWSPKRYEPAFSDRNELGPEDVPVERIRASPVQDGDHGMIELDGRHCRLSLSKSQHRYTVDSRHA